MYKLVGYKELAPLDYPVSTLFLASFCPASSRKRITLPNHCRELVVLEAVNAGTEESQTPAYHPIQSNPIQQWVITKPHVVEAAPN